MPNTTRRTTSILREILLGSLDHDTFAVSSAVPQHHFLKQCVVVQQNGNEPDLSNTISTSAKRLVSSPASPLNVFFIDRTADLKKASRSVLEAKFAFKGTSHFAPDIVFVHEAIRTLFSGCLSKNMQTFTSPAAVKHEKSSKVNEDVKFEGWALDTKGRIGFIKNLYVNLI